MPFLRNLRPTLPKFPRARKPQQYAQPVPLITTVSTSGDKRRAQAIRRVGAFLRRKGPSVGGKALDATETGLKVAGAVTGLVPVPMLDVSLQVASAIVQVAQTMRTNKEDCSELAQEVTGYKGVLSEYEGQEFTEGDLYALQELQDQLDLTLGNLKGIAGQALLAQLCYHSHNKRSITQCRDRLATAFHKYTLRSQISSHVHQIQVLTAVQAVPVCAAKIMAPLFFLPVQSSLIGFGRGMALTGPIQRERTPRLR